MFFTMAWRNIWRNRRRTLVILTAIVIGVWSMVLLGALMRGMVVQMVNNGISTLTGHVQVHAKGYHADPVIEHSMQNPAEVEAALKAGLPSGSHWAGRVRVNAVASNAHHTTGVTLVGIEPQREAAVSFIGQHAVSQGKYLAPGEARGILAGAKAVDEFDSKLGFKLILMSQDTTKQIASRAFRISGIYRAELEATEKQFVFVTQAAAQKMLKMGGALSEFAVWLPQGASPQAAAAALKKALPADKYEVMTWQELLPVLEAYTGLFDGFVLIWYVVVFIAMGFGIINTTLMAVMERIREFGLLKALGMRPGWVIREVVTESFYILLIGIAAGNVLGLAMVALLAATGIDLSALAAGSEFFGFSRVLYPVLSVRDLLTANLVVFLLGMLVSIYPAAKAARFTPVEAMAHL